jgi:hypothetical protein
MRIKRDDYASTSSWQSHPQSTTGRYGYLHALCTRTFGLLVLQKYGHVAFDSSQKAVLTSCVLRYKPALPAAGANAPKGPGPGTAEGEAGFVHCCFSITVRRDVYGIPSMIVGNFIRVC